MFYLRYRVRPTNDHPEREMLGEGMVCCWIERPSLAEADGIAQEAIRDEQWDVLESEEGREIREEEYDADDEDLEFYQQAVLDKEVFVFHTSPRYPVFHVEAEVTDAQSVTTAEAHYFLCGESILREGEDVYDPAFWAGERQEIALTAATDAIREAGWAVVRVVLAEPCGRDDLPEELLSFYDEAEEAGACVVFVHDDESDATGEDE